MDETKTGDTPRFESTPEAHLLTPSGEATVTSTSASQGSEAAAAQSAPASDTRSGGAQSGSGDTSLPRTAELREIPPGSDLLGERGREVAERLKPVAAAAEEVAAKAVDLSVKGLTRLGALLDKRRQERGGGDKTE